ncbi:unnamed protein product, partial [Phyllotreta striolata]
ISHLYIKYRRGILNRVQLTVDYPFFFNLLFYLSHYYRYFQFNPKIKMLKIVGLCFLVVIMALGVQSMYLEKYGGRDFYFCADQKNPGKLVAHETIKKPKVELIDVRIPESGVLENKISCILVVDNKGSGCDPLIVRGGLGSEFVEISVPRDSLHLDDYDYSFSVYVTE